MRLVGAWLAMAAIALASLLMVPPAGTALEARLTDRVAALEAQVADLSTRVAALEARPWPSPTSVPSPAPTATPTPSPAPTPPPTAAPSPGPTTPSSPSAVPCPTTLQAGINATPVGRTLDVTGCLFSAAATVNRSLTLRGGTLTGAVLSISAGTTVVIEGFTSLDAPGAMQSEGGAIHADGANVTLRHVTVARSLGSGIGFRNGTYLVEDSTLDANRQEGFAFGGSGSFTLTRSTVSRNNSAAAPGPLS